MGETKRNWWWDRGYTARTLAWSAVSFAAVAVGGAVFRLVYLSSDDAWWVLPVGLALCSVFYAWQARRLRAYERARRAQQLP